MHAATSSKFPRERARSPPECMDERAVSGVVRGLTPAIRPEVNVGALLLKRGVLWLILMRGFFLPTRIFLFTIVPSGSDSLEPSKPESEIPGHGGGSRRREVEAGTNRHAFVACRSAARSC